MKIMPFKNAMKKAGMRLVYGGRHAVYKKKSIYDKFNDFSKKEKKNFFTLFLTCIYLPQ
jgi:hypothetical protein